MSSVLLSYVILGVGFGMRAIGKSLTPVMNSKIDDTTGEWTVVITAAQVPLAQRVLKFRLGVESDDVTTDGRKVKVRLYTLLTILINSVKNSLN